MNFRPKNNLRITLILCKFEINLYDKKNIEYIEYPPST